MYTCKQMNDTRRQTYCHSVYCHLWVYIFLVIFHFNTTTNRKYQRADRSRRCHLMISLWGFARYCILSVITWCKLGLSQTTIHIHVSKGKGEIATCFDKTHLIKYMHYKKWFIIENTLQQQVEFNDLVWWYRHINLYNNVVNYPV